ncbi:MAG: bifunctional pyr operon transcriptional regulator/uracil phosphoribosyltransferase PyrR [Syntrophobacteraceae bacterium]
MKDYTGRIVLQSEEIERSLQRMAEEIVQESLNPAGLALVGIHTGGVHLARRLERIIRDRFQLDLPVGALDINLYRDDWTRLHTQPVVKASEIPFIIDDREVVLIDDVLYTGRTIRAALDALVDFGRPKRVQLCVLVDRGHRELPICGQFIGIQIETLNDEMVNVLLTEKDGVDQVVIESPV